MLPFPSPTLVGLNLLQMKVSFITELSGTASSMVL
jgi:hypothetical protein